MLATPNDDGNNSAAENDNRQKDGAEQTRLGVVFHIVIMQVHASTFYSALRLGPVLGETFVFLGKARTMNRLPVYLPVTLTLIAMATRLPAADKPTMETVRKQLVQQGALAEDITETGVTLRGEFKGGDQAFALLVHLPQVETIYISEAKITGEGLAHLAKLPKLKTLSISHTGMEPAAVKHLAKLPIESLSLHGVALQREQLEALADIMTLQRLSLSGPTIDDAALEPLARMGSLRRLQLLRTSLTDKGIGQLNTLEKLEHLSVEESQGVSNAALVKLWDDLPKLRIIGAAGGIAAAKGQKLGFSGED